MSTIIQKATLFCFIAVGISIISASYCKAMDDDKLTDREKKHMDYIKRETKGDEPTRLEKLEATKKYLESEGQQVDKKMLQNIETLKKDERSNLY
jgi:hypothetical protein